MMRGAAAKWRPAWSLLGILLAYYAFPVELNGSPVSIGISLLLSAAGLALLSWMLVLELVHRRAGGQGRTARVLSMMLILLIMSFSLAFYLLDQLDSDQIAGLRTRTDALYFTLSTMATVGYGDVHAVGQAARALVCGLIVFNIVVVASLVRAYASPEQSER